MSTRLPSAERYALQVDKGVMVAPLAPTYALPIPLPLAKGAASSTYPWQWSVMPDRGREYKQTPGGDLNILPQQ